MIVDVFTITKLIYLVGLFINSVQPLYFDIYDFKFFGCTVGFNSAIARKGDMPLPITYISHIPYSYYAIYKQKCSL